MTRQDDTSGGSPLGRYKLHRGYFARGSSGVSRPEPLRPSRADQFSASAEGGAKASRKDGPVMCRFSRLGRCASERPPGERQNGEAKAGEYNAPQRRGPRDLQVGPFEAIQRMFVSGHLPLPLGLLERLEAPFCRSDHRGPLRVGQRRIDAAGERADVIAHRRATHTTIARMIENSVIVRGASRAAHVPSETPS